MRRENALLSGPTREMPVVPAAGLPLESPMDLLHPGAGFLLDDIVSV